MHKFSVYVRIYFTGENLKCDDGEHHADYPNDLQAVEDGYEDEYVYVVLIAAGLEKPVVNCRA